MFDNLFENRNKTVSSLLKLSDCLGRSLRENIQLFSINSEAENATFVSETGKVISGSFTLGEDIELKNIKIQDSSVFSDNETFDNFVNKKVRSFVSNINEDSYSEANTSFSDVLSLWETRLKFETVRKNLEEKKELFGEQNNIVYTEEFQNLLEVFPQLCKFLEENKKDVVAVPEIGNALKLSDSVAKAFNFPRLDYETLAENKDYKIVDGVNTSVYELICKQELVKKELIESRKNFEDVWITNPSIKNLCSHLYEEDEDKLIEALIAAIVDVPYLALAKKKQLQEIVNNTFCVTNDESVLSENDIKDFVSKLFEMKKPIKDLVVNVLNEKYGINIQNLKSPASFKSLVETQIVIFETLSRLSPKSSVIKEVLSNVASMLKGKSGVEAIDVNDALQEIFNISGYTDCYQSYKLIEEVDFKDIVESNFDIEEIFNLIKEKRLSKEQENERHDEDSKKGYPKKGIKGGTEEAEKEEDKGEEEKEEKPTTTKKKKATKKKAKKKKGEDEDENGGANDDSEGDEENDKKGQYGEGAESETEEESDEDTGEMKKTVSREDFLNDIKEVEGLLDDLDGPSEDS